MTCNSRTHLRQERDAAIERDRQLRTLMGLGDKELPIVLGVGDGTGNLYVYGSCEATRVTQEKLIHAGQAEAREEFLKTAVQRFANECAVELDHSREVTDVLGQVLASYKHLEAKEKTLRGLIKQVVDVEPDTEGWVIVNRAWLKAARAALGGE